MIDRRSPRPYGSWATWSSNKCNMQLGWGGNGLANCRLAPATPEPHITRQRWSVNLNWKRIWDPDPNTPSLNCPCWFPSEALSLDLDVWVHRTEDVMMGRTFASLLRFRVLLSHCLLLLLYICSCCSLLTVWRCFLCLLECSVHPIHLWLLFQCEKAIAVRWWDFLLPCLLSLFFCVVPHVCVTNSSLPPVSVSLVQSGYLIHSLPLRWLQMGSSV